LPNKGPFVIRYPRGGGVLLDWRCPLEEIPVGKGRKLHEGSDVAVLTIGPIGNNATEAIKRLNNKISVAHYDMRFLKPLDTAILDEVCEKFNRIITVEDGILNGGFGSAVLEYINDHNRDVKVERMGIPDKFVEHGSVKELRKLIHLDADAICKQIEQ
jgi:1-deoxy-D-xylulose-5-phosphate synthase